MAASEILNYQGNAGLGLGSSPEIGVLPENPNLSAVVQTGRDLLLSNIEKNRIIYQQKVKDRDTLLGLIDESKVDVGNILPDDRNDVEKSFKNLEDASSKIMNKDGTINTEGYTAYQKAYRQAKETTTLANLRYVNKTGADTESSKMQLPWIRKAMEENTANNMKKGLYGYWQPYQQTLNYELEPINAFAELQKVDYQDPTNPFIKGKEEFYDWANAQSKAQNAFLDMKDGGKLSYYMTEFLSDMQKQGYDPAKRDNLEESLNHMNEQLKKYNAIGKSQIVPDKDGKLVKWTKDKNGNILINESASDFAAKWALANKDTFTNKIPDEKALALLTAAQREKEFERRNKALEGIDWAKLGLEKNKFDVSTNGSEESKNAALAASKRIYTDLTSNASRTTVDGNSILTSDDLRKLSADQLKYLGIETPTVRNPQTGVITKSSGLQPLQLNEDDVIEVTPDGKIKVLMNATFDEKRQVWKGKWDNTRSTSIQNVARNILNEENTKSGGKERNAYLPIDLGGSKGIIQIDKSGGGTKKSGVLIFNDGSKIDLTQTPLTDEEIQQAIKSGAKKQ